jgi:hypothetical protein
MMILQERLHVSIEGGLVEDDHMIQTIEPKGANHPFHEGSLRRRARSRKAHGSHILAKLDAEDAIAVRSW